MHMTIAQAAQHANVDRSTISRAIKSGKLSVTILSNGQKGISPAEFERVYPSDRPRPNVHSAPQQPAHAEMPELHVHLMQELRDRIRFLEGELVTSKERENRLLGLLETKQIEDKRNLTPWWKLWRKAA